MKTVRKLTFEGNKWHFDVVPALEATTSELNVVVQTVLLPPGGGDAGLWVGHSSSHSTERYAGWGPLTEELCIRASDVIRVWGQSSDISAGLMVPACGIVEAIRAIGPVTSVAVVSTGLLAAFVEKYLSGKVTLKAAKAGADVDLLIDTTGEPTLWNSALSALCREGTLLLLVPPWASRSSFNFYPYLHTRSLRVVAKRWHHPSATLDREVTDGLLTIISAIVDEGRWVCPIDTIDRSQPGPWRWFHW